MQDQRKTSFEDLLRNLIARLPDDHTKHRRDLYLKLISHANELPEVKRPAMIARIREAIAKVEGEIQEQMLFREVHAAAAPASPTGPSFVQGGPPAQTRHHSPDAARRGNRMRVASGVAVILMVAGLAAYGWALHSGAQGNDDRSVVDRAGGTIPAGTGRAASETGGEGDSPALNGSQDTVFFFGFPDALKKFVVSSGSQPVEPDLVNSDEGFVRYNADIYLLGKELLPLDPRRTYIGTVKFRLARQPKAGDLLPAVHVGIRNYDGEGKLLAGNASYTDFVYSGRMKVNELAQAVDGFFIVSDLLHPAGSGEETTFEAGATQFRAFVRVNAQGTEIPVDLSSFGFVAID